ncbi:MAG: hypothetical protein NZM38_10525 [Cytophagales bacterium]|nr:hypothetical protein [Cytophagales bacterium]MDW8385189.1 FISUMP domain-containing protein [Flammeovirgaceae bacterium]
MKTQLTIFAIFLCFTFVKSQTFTDNRDGKTYKIVTIGKQIWMAENLAFKTEDSFCYDNDEALCEKYGRLYTAEEAENVCPQGWRLPNAQDWRTLEMTLGMPAEEIEETGWRGTTEGTKLKVGGSSGFNAILGGKMTPNGNFSGLNLNGNYWSSTKDANGYNFYRYVAKDKEQIGRLSISGYAFSVRCIKE